MSSRTIFRCLLPKGNERGPLAFEQILASLHGLFARHARRSKNETVSFEIARIDGCIHFYVSLPTHLRTLVSSQIYSQYPEAELTEVPEYFSQKILRGKSVLLADLQPKRAWVFPFKRYPQFEDQINRHFEDPLGPITSSLSKLFHRNDSAIIQITLAPIPADWNSAAENTLRRFLGGGMWQFHWFQNFYQSWRLGFSRWSRWLKSPLWGMIIFFLGWSGKARNLSQAVNQNDDEEDQNWEREAKTSGKHDRETITSACYDKLQRLHFAVNVRAMYFHSDPDSLHADAKIREIIGTFQQFSLPGMNQFGLNKLCRNRHNRLFYHSIRRELHQPFALSQEELATVFHFPTATVTSPSLQWVTSRKIEAPYNLPTAEPDITLLGKTNFHHSNVPYGLRPADRARHVYIIGKTGMGKSTLLENMIFSDIQAGKGVGVIDPHGDLAEAVLRFIPSSRTNDVVWVDPSDRDWPIAFNMLEGKNTEQRELIASGMIGVVKKLNIDSWGPRLEHFLRNTLLALVEAPDTTMLGVTRMLVDPAYRQKVLKFVTNIEVRNFWEKEFSALAPQKLAEAVGPIQNKVGQFLSTPFIRNILGQPKSTLDLRFAMDKKKIVIVNLSKGKIGEDNAALLGSMLITKFQIDAMSRADTPESERVPFHLFVDEFQNFATDSFATILSEARKYKLNLTMANQFIAQMSEDVAAAVFGNVGSLAVFQVGVDDAKVLAEQFDEEVVSLNDLTNLPKYSIYNRILVDGMPTPVFSANTLPPPELPDESSQAERCQKILAFSRQRYAKPRDKVEEKIIRWSRQENDKSRPKPDLSTDSKSKSSAEKRR